MEKVIRDGKVAIVISGEGGGAGWYSWHGEQQLVFHPKIVEMVESNRHS